MTLSEQQLGLWPDVAVEPTGAAIREVRGRPGLRPASRQTSRFVPLVLASGSSSKINVLRLLGLRFKVDPADIDEQQVRTRDPASLVQRLSAIKAAAVASKHPQALVIGADTVIVYDGSIIGKPKSPDEAKAILGRLSGRTHEVLTGVTVVGPGSRTVTRLCTTAVRMRPYSPETIMRYVGTEEPFGKAGSYALQGVGGILVESIEGEYTNVLGLPVATFVDALNALGYDLI